MSPEDQAQVADMVQKGVAAGLAAVRQQIGPAVRTAAEVGSPEFAEDRTQINSLNNKWIFAKEVFSHDGLVRQGAQLFQVSLDAMIENNALAKKLHQKFFDGVDDRARIRDGWDYSKSYDLANPNTLGTSDNVRGGVVPQNRAIDEATVQSVVNSNTFQAAVQAAVADAINGTIPTFEAAVGAAVAAALANTPSASPKA